MNEAIHNYIALHTDSDSMNASLPLFLTIIMYFIFRNMFSFWK